LNPASVIGKAPSVRVTIQGKLSGKIVREFTKPTGPVLRPREVALTFDDGPWPGDTASILDILKRFHVKASFFVVGYLAERYPTLVRREVQAGMTVGNHSWSHPTEPPFRDLQPVKIQSEMAQPNEIIQRFESPVRLFRPPGGSWSDEVRTTAEGLGMRLVLWDIDTLDWKSSTTPKQITKKVLSQVRPGSIVLMHDGGGDAGHTIKALPAIIKGIRSKHLQLVAL
jgi:peptidoglycan/xylan/chitin deacetylase (PgdA/CDA1 family)